MSIRTIFHILSVIVFWFVPNAAPAQINADLKSIADHYWEAQMVRYPTRATALGDYRYNDRLEDVSEQGRRSWKASLELIRDQVRRMVIGDLSPEDRLTRDLLERAINDDLLSLETRMHLLPLDPLDGPHISFPLILVSQPFRDAADFQAYAARLNAFSAHMNDQIVNLRAGLREKWVSPRVTIEKVVPQVWTHIVDDPTKSEFFKPIMEKAAELKLDEREAAEKAVKDAITTSVVPAYRDLLVFVKKEYLPVCREAVGIGAVPGGLETYEKLARLNMTVSLSTDEAHNIGLSEVKRIRGEMDRVRTEMGFSGSLDEFIAHMRTDPKQRFSSREELIAEADAILQRTKPLMSKLFRRIPKADCVMKEMESFRAAASPVAYYNPTPEDGSRPGYYYINTYAPQERLRFTLEALTYHESIPGHHFQMALDQENKSLPKFRRYGDYTAYVEGWALYTEKLGYEIGGYQTPASRFGQLCFEMWRACRLVVDTGMHAKGWGRKQAIDFMAANTSLALLDIESEMDRYISWPGQALAYKIGELRIVQLRKDAEKALGDRFDVKDFHDTLLSGGAMPIDLLETRMRAWIEASK